MEREKFQEIAAKLGISDRRLESLIKNMAYRKAYSRKRYQEFKEFRDAMKENPELQNSLEELVKATAASRNTETKSRSKGQTIRIKWFRSAIQAPQKHKRVVRGLGFTRLNQIVEREDTPSIRGMVNKVPHLVEIVDGTK